MLRIGHSHPLAIDCQVTVKTNTIPALNKQYATFKSGAGHSSAPRSLFKFAPLPPHSQVPPKPDSLENPLTPDESLITVIKAPPFQRRLRIKWHYE